MKVHHSILFLLLLVVTADAAIIDKDLKFFHIKPFRASGPIETQMNIVILSSGYTSSQSGNFIKDAAALSDMLLTPHYPSLEATVPLFHLAAHCNIFSVFVPSPQEGASDLSLGVTKDTALDCTIIHELHEYDGKLQCDVNLAAAFAEVTEAKPSLYPSTTLIIALVNVPGVRGARAVNYPYAFIPITFRSFDVKNSLQERRAFLEMFSHALGHAIFGLADEYDQAGITESSVVSYPNCVAPFVETPWYYWIIHQQKFPSVRKEILKKQTSSDDDDIISSRGENDNDDVTILDLTLDGIPSTPCSFSNYRRPSSSCLMNQWKEPEAGVNAQIQHYCAVCRGHSVVQFYEQVLTTVNKPTIAHPALRSVGFLLWPRCPMPHEIILTTVTEKVWLHTNKFTIPSRGFMTRWLLNGEIRIAENVTSLEISVLRMLDLGKLSSFVITLEVTDFISQRWITASQQTRVNNFVQSTNFSFQTVRNPKSFLGWKIKECVNPLFQQSIGQFRSLCTEKLPSGEVGNCEYSYQTSDTVSSLTQSPARSIGMNILLFASLLLIAVPWLYFYFVYYRTKVSPLVPKDLSKLHLKLNLLSHPQEIITRSVLIFSLMVWLSALSGFFTGLKLYVIANVLTSLSLFIVTILALLFSLVGFLSFCGVLLRNPVFMMINGVLISIFCVVVLGIMVGVNQIESSLADPESTTMNSLRAMWIDTVSASPNTACELQLQFHCSGWDRPCDSLNATLTCPGNCKASAGLTTPCQFAFSKIALKKFLFVLNVMRGVIPILVFVAIGHFYSFYAFRRVRAMASRLIMEATYGKDENGAPSEGKNKKKRKNRRKVRISEVVDDDDDDDDDWGKEQRRQEAGEEGIIEMEVIVGSRSSPIPRRRTMTSPTIIQGKNGQLSSPLSSLSSTRGGGGVRSEKEVEDEGGNADYSKSSTKKLLQVPLLTIGNHHQEASFSSSLPFGGVQTHQHQEGMSSSPPRFHDLQSVPHSSSRSRLQNTPSGKHFVL